MINWASFSFKRLSCFPYTETVLRRETLSSLQNPFRYWKRKEENEDERKSESKNFKYSSFVAKGGTLLTVGLIGVDKIACDDSNDEDPFSEFNKEVSHSERNSKKRNGRFYNFEKQYSKKITVSEAVSKAAVKVNALMVAAGIPGVSISVSLNGKSVWARGFGYADVENYILMIPDTVMRIDSMSNTLTMIAVDKLIDEGKLDLDAPIQKYVHFFPRKYVNGEEVTITTRHLLTHTLGIRRFAIKPKNPGKSNESKSTSQNDSESTTIRCECSMNGIETQNKRRIERIDNKSQKMNQYSTCKEKKIRNGKPIPNKSFGTCLDPNNLEEYLLKEKFHYTKEALEVFKDDKLFFEPGENYLYSTHGLTLVSAVVEGIVKKPFKKYIREIFMELDMMSTFAEEENPIIQRRGRYYIRDEQSGRLKNAPYANNSHKVVGGGLASTVLDLTHFGNALLFSYQNNQNEGIINSSTIQKMFTKNVINGTDDSLSGLSWFVEKSEEDSPVAYGNDVKFFAYHSGEAVGASSCILIMPKFDPYDSSGDLDENLVRRYIPEGVVVSIISNLGNVDLSELALCIAKIFDNVKDDNEMVLMEG